MKAIWKTAAVFGMGLAALTFTPSVRADDDDDRRHRRGHEAVSFFFNIAHEGFRFSVASAPHRPVKCEPPRRWVAGYYEVRREKVVHPGYWREEVIPAQYGWVKDRCGTRRHVVIKPECRRRVWVPERCEWVETKVWIPGRHEEARYARAY